MSLFPLFLAEEATEYGGRVRVLSPEVAHRIAAGEVIERPASAVKELIENSLDAGASRIEVDIEGGGISLIRVRDDGSGMSPEDAQRAVGRHATSKILTADDLAHVDTLGFRGEALHAMGAVSSLALTTCERGAGFGARVGVFAGEIVECAPAAHPPGTTLEVRNLFLNLPVRRGFLSTERAEAKAVCTVVEALALSRPLVGFFLRSEGRGVLALPAAADLRERISQVHGLALARSLIALEDPVLWGFVSPISVSFPTRRYTHVAVNGRVVETDSFAPAISKAYADLLPKGRHPAALLRLELGYGEVDVNVHPAKSAVRLRGGRSAYPLVVGTIRAALAPEQEAGGRLAPEEQVAELTPIGQFAGRCTPCSVTPTSGRLWTPTPTSCPTSSNRQPSAWTRCWAERVYQNAKPPESGFLVIQNPVSLCGLTRSSDLLSGPGRATGRFCGPTAQFYAGSCIRSSENLSSRHWCENPVE